MPEANEKQTSNTLKSTSHMMRLVGGPLLALGILALAGSNFGLVALSTVAAITAVGTALTIGGYVGEYASGIAPSKYENTIIESKAIEEARGLVQDFKAANSSVAFEQNTRNDGRSWVQATGKGSSGMQPTV
jgi:hypothetical protein